MTVARQKKGSYSTSTSERAYSFMRNHLIGYARVRTLPLTALASEQYQYARTAIAQAALIVLAVFSVERHAPFCERTVFASGAFGVRLTPLCVVSGSRW